MAGEAGRLNRLAAAVALLLAMPLLLADAGPDPVRSLAGRVSNSFADGFIDGSSYAGENVVEVVPVSAKAAYFRLHLDYFNGHQCGMSGVARAEGDRLVYHDPSPAITAGKPCTLSLSRVGRLVAIDDDGGTCRSYCGARGTLTDVGVPWSSHRPISYLARLRASSEYRDALAEWRTGKPAR